MPKSWEDIGVEDFKANPCTGDKSYLQELMKQTPESILAITVELLEELSNKEESNDG